MPEQLVELPPAEATHALRVLRLQSGERLRLLNGCGIRAEAELLPTTDKKRRQQSAQCRVISREQCPKGVPTLQLYIAPPRGKMMDLILRSAAELGVERIVPILCRYGVAKPEHDKDSWQQSLIAACKQSGNPYLPSCDSPVAFQRAVNEHSAAMGFFGAVPRAGDKAQALSSIAADSLSLWIGPEGGFAPEEEDALRHATLQPLSIGPWILRVETALPALLGALYAMLKA